jgi:hypothetical protein
MLGALNMHAGSRASIRVQCIPGCTGTCMAGAATVTGGSNRCITGIDGGPVLDRDDGCSCPLRLMILQQSADAIV